MTKRIVTVVGNRPQFVKAAVVSRYLRESDKTDQLSEILVHTGQHYDTMLSDVFFEELGLPEPTVNLGIGSGSIADQISRMLRPLHDIFEEFKPDGVLVYGDTNSTLACGITAAHHGLPLFHVEAGERIFRRRQVPEEINRVVTDACSWLCLTATEKASRYLEREGVAPSRIRFVGDPMYDLFLFGMERLAARAGITPASLGLDEGSYDLATIHRVENTSDQHRLLGLLRTLDAGPRPVVLPVHPRVRNLLADWSWRPEGNLRLNEPLGYFDFLRLLTGCHHCLTDSGGVSRESFFAGKPSIVPMENCWWPEIVEAGWAVTTGHDLDATARALAEFEPAVARPEGLFGHGDSAARIVAAIVDFLDAGRTDGDWHPLGFVDRLPKAAATNFTHSSYRSMLGALRTGGYHFASFAEAEILLEQSTRFVLLRHDVDLELESALAIAELEAAEGVAATYFFMVRTEHYNIFSADGTAFVDRILALGHFLGLHFDAAAYPENASVPFLAEACAREANLLETWFGRPVVAVSYHRPNQQILRGDPALSAPRPHSYMPLFTREIQYLSDSQGHWGHGHPLQSAAFAAGKPLHLLVHPVWWQERPTAPFERIQRVVDGRLGKLQASIAANCKVYRVGCLDGEYRT